MAHYDAEDIVELKNRKKRRKRLFRLLTVFLVMLVIYGFYYYRDLWLPKLKGIGKQYKTIVNDGELAEGNFPIEINGGADYQLRYGDDTLYLLSDAYTYYYNLDGAKIKKRQHAYTNPVLDVSGENAIIFESGGNEFTVENSDEILYSKQTENTIIFARVSGKGMAAVATTSDNYACELTVYDKSGSVIYERSCVDRISDISFVNESKGCILSFLGADNGALATNIIEISFNSKDSLWESPPVDTLGLDTFVCGKGAVIIGYTACAYISGNGQISSYYKYDGDFAGGDSQGGKTAVIINDDDRRKYSLALFSGAENPLIIDFDSPLKYVEIYDGLAYVMSQSEIRAYDFSGGLRSTAAISDSYSEFRRSGDYIFLMSYNHIDRIDFNS
ncbi:MAG: DUF5711 family protein [Ruminococcus sp.]